jgi:hypothetical protein
MIGVFDLTYTRAFAFEIVRFRSRVRTTQKLVSTFKYVSHRRGTRTHHELSSACRYTESRGLAGAPHEGTHMFLVVCLRLSDVTSSPSHRGPAESANDAHAASCASIAHAHCPWAS